LAATMADGRAQVHASADKFKLTANADLATSAPYVAKADVAIDALDLKTLPMTHDAPITGSVTAHVTATSDLSNPLDASVAATLAPLAITYNGQPISTDGTSTLRYENRELAIDRLVVHAQDSTVSLNGTLPLESLPVTGTPATGAPTNTSGAAREGTINLDAQANLATLATYAPQEAGVKAQGTLAINGTIRGTLRHIDPTLTMTIDNASIGAEALKQNLSNVGLQATIAEGALHFTDLHAS